MAAPTSYLKFPIKKLPITTIPFPLLIHGLLGFFLLYIIFDWGKKLINILSSQSQFDKISKMGLDKNKQICQDLPSKEKESLCSEEVEFIMSRLGIYCHQEGEMFDLDNICDIFDVEEHNTLEELREAFDVFDENKDGFIDERELQRILNVLGLSQDVENCRKMIMAFDENGDGRIDFDEFVKII